jgi:hypothetical protein
MVELLGAQKMLAIGMESRYPITVQQLLQSLVVELFMSPQTLAQLGPIVKLHEAGQMFQSLMMVQK